MDHSISNLSGMTTFIMCNSTYIMAFRFVSIQTNNAKTHNNKFYYIITIGNQIFITLTLPSPVISPTNATGHLSRSAIL